MPEREARTGLHKAGVTLGDGDGDPGGDERTTTAGLEAGLGASGEVVARVARVLTLRKRNVGIEAANADVEVDSARLSGGVGQVGEQFGVLFGRERDVVVVLRVVDDDVHGTAREHLDV